MNKRIIMGVIVLFALICIVKPLYADEGESNQLILIGDSRTVGMSAVIGDDGNIWIAKPNIGFSWMKSTAIPQAENKMKDGMKVVIMMGVNDVLGNSTVEKYADYLNDKALEWKEDGVECYYVSVNPVTYATANGELTNKKIEEWNEEIQELFNDDITYVDSYSKVEGKLYAGDGLHYDSDSYTLIYNTVKSEINRIEFERMLSDIDVDADMAKGSARMKIPGMLIKYTADMTVSAYYDNGKGTNTDNSGVEYGTTNYVDTGTTTNTDSSRNFRYDEDDTLSDYDTSDSSTDISDTDDETDNSSSSEIPQTDLPQQDIRTPDSSDETETSDDTNETLP